jgi:hypothetical protein
MKAEIKCFTLKDFLLSVVLSFQSPAGEFHDSMPVKGLDFVLDF